MATPELVIVGQLFETLRLGESAGGLASGVLVNFIPFATKHGCAVFVSLGRRCISKVENSSSPENAANAIRDAFEGEFCPFLLHPISFF